MFALQTPEAICRSLGERVRLLRLARNLSQLELAGMCGSSLSSIRRLEAQGQGTLNLLVRAALALNVIDGLDDLLVLPSQTIAQAQAAAGVQQRRRARKPAGDVGRAR